MERHHPMRLQAMDQMTQRLGFRFGAGAPPVESLTSRTGAALFQR